MDGSQGTRVFRIGEGITDRNSFQSGDSDNLARQDLVHFLAVQALIDVQVTGLIRQYLAILDQARNGIPYTQLAGGNPAHGGHAAIIIVTHRGHKHLKRRIQIDTRSRYMAQDRLEEGLQIRP